MKNFKLRQYTSLALLSKREKLRLLKREKLQKEKFINKRERLQKE